MISQYDNISRNQSHTKKKTAAEAAAEVCSSNVSMISPVSRSHNFMVVSTDPLTSTPVDNTHNE